MTGAAIQALAMVAIALCFSHPAAAQVYSITSVSTADIGNVAAAASGNTIFTVDPSTGTVTKISGNGARLSAGATRSLITISCGNQGPCSNDDPVITITQTGTPTGRANPLTNFTLSVSGASATIVTPPGAGNSITATLGPIGRNASKTIYVGMDTTYSGDISGGATGVSNTNFAVTVTNNKGNGAVSSSGLVTATVFRTLTITTGTPLAFGRVSRPRTGTGTVSLAPGAASVAVTGDGVAATSSPVPTSAILTATGEGGQAVTITVPSTFTMFNGANSLAVTTNATNAGAQNLGGTLGSAGTKTVTVGGAFSLTPTTPLGAYNGSMIVTFQYN
jgi:hypothetical protein